MRFSGRVAMVTGGGRGIGEATCVLLGVQGATVVVSDMDGEVAADVARRINESGGTAASIAADVTSARDAQAMVAFTTEQFGRLDILVCSAGVTRDNLLFKMTDDDWDAVIDTHLKGTFNCVRAAQAPMVQQKYGKIILLSSTGALGNRGQTNYSTAKAGLQGMARALALELGPFNVNVNTVAPGFVETRMTQATAERLGVEWETYKQQRADASPLRRTGKPVDIANVIAFFASEDSSFVTGQTLYVAGGSRG
jgi:3-oxoacyl-[acyl-carrier protein] reductase